METYAPVARLESICILLAYAAHHNFKLQQMDVESAFLYGPLNELVYVKQPPGFEDPNFPNHVYKLDKALYGLKQAPRTWYEHLRELLFDRGFEIGKIDPTLFTKKVNGELFVCQIYVDDIDGGIPIGVYPRSGLASWIEPTEAKPRAGRLAQYGEW